MKTSAVRSAPIEGPAYEEFEPRGRPHKGRAWLIAVAGLLTIVVILVGIKASQIVAMINGGKKFVPPPESVTSAKVEQMKWPASRTAVATLEAVHSVTVSSELTGTVREIGFESGATVKRGALLVKLDTSTEDAQLAAADAQASLAKVTLKRQDTLRKTDANTQADLDSAESQADQTSANSAVLRSTISKKTIRAPFDGRLGIRQVELGEVLSPGTAIATLQSVTPIYANFWLPQQAIADLTTKQAVRLHIDDIYPKAIWNGTITTVNPEVDASTRNVRVRATFDNPDGRLQPGMFADVEIISDADREALVIPATAVIYAPYGDAVFVIAEKDKALTAQQKFVRLGEHRGDLVAVVSGLSAGETVVSSGAFKLHNGTAVVVHNELAPVAESAPKPADDK
jgi:membrane fusion protein (multidrug efflux system)